MNPQTQTAEDNLKRKYPTIIKEIEEQAKQQTLKEVEGIIDKRIEFNKKEVIKHFNNNKKSPSNTQVKKELRHRFIVNELKELKQALKDNSSQERCQQKQNKDISLSALDSGYSADTHNITTNISLDELKRYKDKEAGDKMKQTPPKSQIAEEIKKEIEKIKAYKQRIDDIEKEIEDLANHGMNYLKETRKRKSLITNLKYLEGKT